MNESIGVIGLGNAGLALAGALGRHYRVHGYDQKPERMHLSQSLDIKPCVSVVELVKNCDIIFLSLPTPEVSRAVAQSVSEVELS